MLKRLYFHLEAGLGKDMPSNSFRFLAEFISLSLQLKAPAFCWMWAGGWAHVLETANSSMPCELPQLGGHLFYQANQENFMLESAKMKTYMK